MSGPTNPATKDVEKEDPFRRDLRTFLGPNADVFLDIWDRMELVKEPGGLRARLIALRIASDRNNVFSWSWPVFLMPIPWLMYRKMYLWAALWILIPIFLGILDFELEGMTGAQIMLAMYGKSFYLARAEKKVKKISDQAANEEERRGLLQKAGGVSLPAGIMGGAIFVTLIGLTIFATVAPT